MAASSESSDDSERGEKSRRWLVAGSSPVEIQRVLMFAWFACEHTWFIAWNGSSPVEIQRVFMFACEHAWFVAWNGSSPLEIQRVFMFACEHAWFVAWNGSSPVEIQRVCMFACEHAWFVAWNDPGYAFLHTRMLCGSVRDIEGVRS